MTPPFKFYYILAIDVKMLREIDILRE